MTDFNAQRARAKRPCPLWVDAFQRDTQHLGADEVGAYMLILMAMWTRETCDFPDDDKRLAQVARISPRLWKSRIGPVLREFFTVQGDALVSKRLRQEARYVEEYCRKQSGRKSGSSPESTAYAEPTVTPNANEKDAEKSANPLETHDPPPSTDMTTDEPRDHPTQQPNISGGGVGAGASAPPGKPHPDDMTDEDLWDELLHIAGHRQGRVPTYWSPATAVIHIGRWRTDLGLTGSQILNTARQEQARDPDRPPPDGPKAFDKAMQRLAAELQADPLTPKLKAISGGRQNDRRQFAEAHREYTRRLASGAIDRGPDESDPFAQ